MYAEARLIVRVYYTKHIVSAIIDAETAESGFTGH